MPNEWNCGHCKKHFFRYASNISNPERPFCSKACYAQWQRTGLQGSANPNFRAGNSCLPSHCDCGKEKDNRSKKCAECGGKSYPIGKKDQYKSRDEVQLAVTATLSIRDAADYLGISRATTRKYIKMHDIDIRHFVPGRWRHLSPERVLTLSTFKRHGTVKKCVLRLKLLPYVCATCNLSDTWNGSPLQLELDHVNGNSLDNRLENLRFLCPNCHSQTTTYCGRNQRGQRKMRHVQ